jgi:hypothetical protein
VKLLIATHAADIAGKMTVEQMQEAAKLGAYIMFKDNPAKAIGLR